MASAQPMAVVERLLGDDYVHDQIGEAASAMRGAYRRARKLPPERAVVDQRVYDRVRRAAAGLADAAQVALGEPPKRRRGSRLAAAIVLVATGAAVVWAAKADRRSRAPAQLPAATVAPAGAADAPPVS